VQVVQHFPFCFCVQNHTRSLEIAIVLTTAQYLFRDPIIGYQHQLEVGWHSPSRHGVAGSS